MMESSLNKLPHETTGLVLNAPAERRVCSECSGEFSPGRSRTKRCWKCIAMRKRHTSGTSGRRPRLIDTIADLSDAIGELTRAHSELCAIAATGESGHRAEAMLIEPASRIGLAAAFLDVIDRRMGWEKSIRDVSTGDPLSHPAERRQR